MMAAAVVVILYKQPARPVLASYTPPATWYKEDAKDIEEDDKETPLR